ncbi:hypothetical protein HDV02_004241 [Globomyces sp. JEL0801]|nr:hypothetical protein HDV02_004241 [Globomyces sp. JEL0801]
MTETESDEDQKYLVNLSKLKSIRRNKKISDIDVFYDQTSHFYHKFILILHSDYFETCFESFNTDRIDLSDSNFPPQVLDAVFDTIYGDFKSENVTSWLKNGHPVDILYQAADYFQLEYLKNLIDRILTNSESFMSDTITFDSIESINHVVESMKEFYLTNNTRFTKFVTNEVRKKAASEKFRDQLHKFPGYLLNQLVKQGIDDVLDIDEFELFKTAWERMKEDGRIEESEVIRNEIIDRFDFKYIDSSKAFELCQNLDDTRRIFSPSTPKVSNEIRAHFSLMESFSNYNQKVTYSWACTPKIEGKVHTFTLSTTAQTMAMNSTYTGCHFGIVAESLTQSILIKGVIKSSSTTIRSEKSVGDPKSFSYTLILKPKLIFD